MRVPVVDVGLLGLVDARDPGLHVNVAHLLAEHVLLVERHFGRVPDDHTQLEATQRAQAVHMRMRQSLFLLLIVHCIATRRLESAYSDVPETERVQCSSRSGILERTRACGVLARLAGRDLDGRPGRPELRREDVHPELQLALQPTCALVEQLLKQLLVESSRREHAHLLDALLERAVERPRLHVFGDQAQWKVLVQQRVQRETLTLGAELWQRLPPGRAVRCVRAVPGLLRNRVRLLFLHLLPSPLYAFVELLSTTESCDQFLDDLKRDLRRVTNGG